MAPQSKYLNVSITTLKNNYTNGIPIDIYDDNKNYNTHDLLVLNFDR